jgi:hypothetical protein
VHTYNYGGIHLSVGPAAVTARAYLQAQELLSHTDNESHTCR